MGKDLDPEHEKAEVEDRVGLAKVEQSAVSATAEVLQRLGGPSGPVAHLFPPIFGEGFPLVDSPLFFPLVFFGKGSFSH